MKREPRPFCFCVSTSLSNQALHLEGPATQKCSQAQNKREPQIPCSFCQNLVRQSGQAGNTISTTSSPLRSNTQNKPQPWVPPIQTCGWRRGGARHPSLPRHKAGRPGLPYDSLLCSNQAAWPPRQWLCSCRL